MRLLAVLLALWTTGAYAQARELSGRGRVALAPSLSYVPDGPFTTNAQNALQTQRLSDAPLAFGGWATFGYGATPEIEAAVDLMANLQTLRFEGRPSFNRMTYGAGIGARWIFRAELGPVELQPRLALGLLGMLVNVHGGGVTSAESFLTGYSAALGADLIATETLGIGLEYRFLYGRGRAPPEIGGTINGGGHLLLLGVSYFLPGEPSRPMGTMD